MEYRVLGPLEVSGHRGAASARRCKQRALLALLILNANQVVSRERLIDELWGDEAPETAVTSVQVYVSRLRKLLPDGSLVTRAPGYMLEVEPEAVDLIRFERLVREGRSALAAGAPDRAADTIREAIALWRGPALTEFAAEPLRPARRRPARRPAPRRARGQNRRRPPARTSRRGDRRAGGADRLASAPRAPEGAAHARALPLGEAERGARRVPGPAHDARRDRDRAEREPAAPRAADPQPRHGDRRACPGAAGRRPGVRACASGGRDGPARAPASHGSLRRAGGDERGGRGSGTNGGLLRPSPRRGCGRDRGGRWNGREGARRRPARDVRRRRSRDASRQGRARHAAPADARVRRRAVIADGTGERRGGRRPRLPGHGHSCRCVGAARRPCATR